jgi:hypothetical protein
MEHNQQLIQQHDRLLTVMQEQLKTLTEGMNDIKLMLKGLNNEHRDDNSAIYERINTHQSWTTTELQKMAIEVAVLKTKVIMFGTLAGGAASAIVALIMKYI